MIIPMDPAVANRAVELAMEWGANFGKPTGPRLVASYPDLTPVAGDDYAELAKKAEDAAYGIIHDVAGEIGLAHVDFRVRCRRMVLDAYPWISETTFNGLITRGRYYCWHDGVGT